MPSRSVGNGTIAHTFGLATKRQAIGTEWMAGSDAHGRDIKKLRALNREIINAPSFGPWCCASEFRLKRSRNNMSVPNRDGRAGPSRSDGREAKQEDHHEPNER